MSDLTKQTDFIEEECWLRQPGETAKAFHAFCAYRDFGGNRSLRKVMESLDLPDSRNGIWHAWCSRYQWVKRAEKYDAHLDQIHRYEREKNLREREEKHLQISNKMLEIVEKKLDKFDPDELSQGNLLDWMKSCSQLEKEILSPEDKEEKGSLKQLEISFFEDFKGV